MATFKLSHAQTENTVSLNILQNDNLTRTCQRLSFLVQTIRAWTGLDYG